MGNSPPQRSSTRLLRPSGPNESAFRRLELTRVLGNVVTLTSCRRTRVGRARESDRERDLGAPSGEAVPRLDCVLAPAASVVVEGQRRDTRCLAQCVL